MFMCVDRGAFIPSIMAGDFDVDTIEKALLAIDEEGPDVIELRIPYSVRLLSTIFIRLDVI